MVTFVVTARKVANPIGDGMIDRGFRIVIDPERYDKHRRLAELLATRPGWELDESVHQAVEPESVRPVDPLYPHQRVVLNRLKAREHQ